MICAELWEWGAFKASVTWSRTQNFPPGRGRYGYKTLGVTLMVPRVKLTSIFFQFFFLLLILKARHRLCRKRENPRSLVKGWGGEITTAWSRWPWKHVKEQRVSGVTEMKIFIVAPISPLSGVRYFLIFLGKRSPENLLPGQSLSHWICGEKSQYQTVIRWKQLLQ